MTGEKISALDEQLKRAISHRRLIQLRYHGHLRVAEPHDYGVQHGATMLLIYQLRGSSGTQRSGASGWRLLDVSKIDGCAVLDETFPGSRGSSHRRHHVWDVVYARVG